MDVQKKREIFDYFWDDEPISQREIKFLASQIINRSENRKLLFDFLQIFQEENLDQKVNGTLGFKIYKLDDEEESDDHDQPEYSEEYHEVEVTLKSPHTIYSLDRQMEIQALEKPQMNLDFFGGYAIKILSDYLFQQGLLRNNEQMENYSPLSPDMDIFLFPFVKTLDSSLNVNQSKVYIKGEYNQPFRDLSVRLFDSLVDISKRTDLLNKLTHNSVDLAEEKIHIFNKAENAHLEQLEDYSSYQVYSIPETNLLIVLLFQETMIKIQLVAFFEHYLSLFSQHLFEIVIPNTEVSLKNDQDKIISLALDGHNVPIKVPLDIFSDQILTVEERTKRSLKSCICQRSKIKQNGSRAFFLAKIMSKYIDNYPVFSKNKWSNMNKLFRTPMLAKYLLTRKDIYVTLLLAYDPDYPNISEFNPIKYQENNVEEYKESFLNKVMPWFYPSSLVKNTTLREYVWIYSLENQFNILNYPN